MSAPHHIQTSTAGVVRALPNQSRSDEDQQALIDGLIAGEDWAQIQLYDRYAPQVQRILLRVLGRDPELADVMQETFLQAFGSADTIRDPSALSGWLSSVAVFTARRVIRKRQTKRWLRFWDPTDLPEMEAVEADPSSRQAVRRTYQILEQLPVDERIAFSLRFIDGMKLTEMVEVCGCSLATIKRRLAKADAAFIELAKKDPILRERVVSKDGGEQ